jgi:hypothetical protein
MAAPFTTTSTTLEGQMLEVARELNDADLALPETERTGRTTMSFDFAALEVTIVQTLPITLAGTGNAITVSAAPYLP